MFKTKYDKFQYPNLVLENKNHNFHNCTFANHGNITEELLEAFLAGEEKITPEEAYKMAYLIRQFSNIFSLDYLLAPKLGYYDMKKNKHRRKVLSVFKDCEEMRKLVDFELMFKSNYIRKYEMNRFIALSEYIMTADRAAKCIYIGCIEINTALTFMIDVKNLLKSFSKPEPRGINKKQDKKITATSSGKLDTAVT